MREAPACVYRFFDADGDLVYVGCTISPSRIEHHRFIKRWWTTVSTVTVAHYATRKEALAAELFAIHSEMPRFNRQGTQAWRKVDPFGSPPRGQRIAGTPPWQGGRLLQSEVAP